MLDEPVPVNRILLPVGFEGRFLKVRRTDWTSESSGEIAGEIEFDPISIAYIAEEMISCGASYMTLSASSLFARELADVPTVFKNRIQLVDKKGKIGAKALVLLQPVAEELSINLEDLTKSGWGTLWLSLQFLDFDIEVPLEQFRAFRTICMSTYELLLGIENELQIDIDLERTRAAIEHLHSITRNPVSRENLAVLRGIFGSYRAASIGSVEVFVSPGSEEFVRYFHDFLDDRTYQELVKNAHGLGLMHSLDGPLRNVNRLFKELVAKKKFQSVLQYTTRTIETYSGVPLPSTEVLESILPNSYLPPLVPYGIVIERATKNWQNKIQEQAETDNNQENHKKFPAEEYRASLVGDVRNVYSTKIPAEISDTHGLNIVELHKVAEEAILEQLKERKCPVHQEEIYSVAVDWTSEKDLIVNLGLCCEGFATALEDETLTCPIEADHSAAGTEFWARLGSLWKGRRNPS